MKTGMLWTIALLLLACAVQASVVVQTAPDASALESFAALQVQRYVYLRTGEVPVVGTDMKAATRIVVARNDRAILKAVRDSVKALAPEQYVLKTTTANGQRTLWVVGGDNVGALYGAYRLAEKLGVRFYLHGDVIPDERIKALPDVSEVGKPLFSIRGIQPFHDFPEGPDWWNRDDYLTYIAQLPKMRMNFIGLHCYPEGGAGPEPLVWIGQSGDMDGEGRVRAGYPSHWANTKRQGGWGYAEMSTSEFSAGASLLFPRDDYGPDVMGAALPRPTTPEQSNEVFNGAASLFNAAFYEAHSLGVKTCVGTETPLTIPAEVKARLKERGQDPTDPTVVQELYKGMFQRIARAYPVDYYWLWTPEGWTWGGNSEDELKATVGDIKAALSALDSLGKPFKLATSGWVLGPAQDRKALDNILPKDSPMSCINRSVGHAPVEPSFAGITGRPKWAIPWMENDPVLTAPQPWVGRMRYDAADAKRLGCTGLLGIHWRTKAMAQNVAALADAAWDQSWAPKGFNVIEDKRKDTVDGPLGGKIVTYPQPVESTDDDALYQSVRWDTDGYRLKVPNGTYTVTLKFNDPAYGDPGRRVFGVSIQGAKVIESLDMAARAGKNKAIDFTFQSIKVVDKVLRIDFARMVEYPCIAGIVVEGQGFVRKINCGGDKWQDYEADNKSVDDKSDLRTMPVLAFYEDFARANFGSEAAKPIGKILAGIDGRGLPEPVGWIGGPGGLKANAQPWETVKAQYAFVDKLAGEGSLVHGAGNQERYQYWLNTYRCMAAMAELGCTRGELDAAAAKVESAQEAVEKMQFAEQALVIRIRMARLWERMMTYQLAAVDTPGEMGTVANLEQHTRKKLAFITAYDDLLIEARGASLPPEAAVSTAYTGPARIIVPTVRTQAGYDDWVTVKFIVLDKALPKSVALYVRPLGKGEYREVASCRNIGRATYDAQIRGADDSYEYYITAETADGAKLVWPASAPGISQTVVVMDVPY